MGEEVIEVILEEGGLKQKPKESTPKTLPYQTREEVELQAIEKEFKQAAEEQAQLPKQQKETKTQEIEQPEQSKKLETLAEQTQEKEAISTATYKLCGNPEKCSIAAQRVALRTDVNYCSQCGYKTIPLTIEPEKIAVIFRKTASQLEKTVESIQDINAHMNPLETWKKRGEETERILTKFYKRTQNVLAGKRFVIKYTNPSDSKKESSTSASFSSKDINIGSYNVVPDGALREAEISFNGSGWIVKTMEWDDDKKEWNLHKRSLSDFYQNKATEISLLRLKSLDETLRALPSQIIQKLNNSEYRVIEASELEQKAEQVKPEKRGKVDYYEPPLFALKEAFAESGITLEDPGGSDGKAVNFIKKMPPEKFTRKVWFKDRKFVRQEYELAGVLAYESPSGYVLIGHGLHTQQFGNHISPKKHWALWVYGRNNLKELQPKVEALAKERGVNLDIALKSEVGKFIKSKETCA